MKDSSISVTVIVPRYNYVQILTHGCHYNCPTNVVGGTECFKFKGMWYPIDEHTNEYTRISNI